MPPKRRYETVCGFDQRSAGGSSSGPRRCLDLCAASSRGKSRLRKVLIHVGLRKKSPHRRLPAEATLPKTVAENWVSKQSFFVLILITRVASIVAHHDELITQ